MDAKFLEFYNQELKFIRESGAEFAQEYPKIAGRLGLEGFDCSDPYVERLLEGFAFLSARVHQKLDASFPKFTQHLTELLFPSFLQPIPSMLVAQFNPDYEEGSLAQGVTLSRNTPLHSILGKGEQTACEYRTAHDVTMWPIKLTAAEYINSQALSAYTNKVSIHSVKTPKSAILVTLESAPGTRFSDIDLNHLNLHIRGTESFPLYLFEALTKGYIGALYKTGNNLWRREHAKTQITPTGFNQEQALLPYSNRQFDGFRLLKEYFAFTKRFLFLELENLAPTLRHCDEEKIELLLLLDHNDNRLENLVSADNFALNCTPAINLFPKRAERIKVDKSHHDFHVVPDRLRPLDFEVCSIEHIQGFNTGIEPTVEFTPLYSTNNDNFNKPQGFFTQKRQTRNLNANQRKFGHRSSYIGTEIFINLVDPKRAPFSDDLRQLAVDIMCSNRDLPLMMPLGKGHTDFTIETGAPCESVRCVGEPTRPKAPASQGSTSWDLINQLSINFLGLADGDHRPAINSLKTLLSLMLDKSDFAHGKQIDGIIDVQTEQITARLPIKGPICFGRGVAISITFDELAYEGSSCYMLGMVLEQFFAQYVSINSFTQLILNSSTRGEIHRWPIRIGKRNPI
ncbi:type VI secretion system baseplate subunit TssF [Catenovulum sp. SM1970]|uniref:type VI secretion system baseplate subunit TssF n=1 Tax=Marinifaba aquimaris TaxID=2741323 RepID=UPI0015735ABB|nr:type VI secretion system baseplate subunit TssF [Marinifaba aquimaris]NTS75651.1 type VI secretion system baseplate subunit TssF [Marinifaba aquimaris]